DGTEVEAVPDPGTDQPADDQRPTPGTDSPPADIDGALPGTKRPTPGTDSPPADIEQPLAGVGGLLAERTLTSLGPSSADSVVPVGAGSAAGDRAYIRGRERGVA